MSAENPFNARSLDRSEQIPDKIDETGAERSHAREMHDLEMQHLNEVLTYPQGNEGDQMFKRHREEKIALWKRQKEEREASHPSAN
jgi:hypothetical protein